MKKEITLSDLQEAFPSIDQSNIMLVKRIINKQVDSTVLEMIRGNERWIRQCFNRPSDQELSMNALNYLLEGFGVEPLIDQNGEIKGEYINMGDSYVLTIVYIKEDQSYHLIDWEEAIKLIENT